MPTSRRQFLFSAAAAVTALPAAAQSADRASGFARAHGKQILGPDGKNLLLRGINLGNWFELEGYMFLFKKGPQSMREIEAFFNELIGPSATPAYWKEYRRRYITDRDIGFLAASGLNSVRIPLHYKFFVPGVTEGFELLDEILTSCRRENIWAVLDMHCAPGGQTGANIDDSWNYPWLYDSEKDQQLLCQVWRNIAERYRDNPTVLGYDLLNEPIPHYPRLKQYNDKLEPLYRRVTAAIREVDRNHAIILEAAQWDSNFHVFGPPFDPNLIYEFHKYWTTPTQSVIQEYLDFRDKYNVPLWCGESGENTDSWISQFRTVLDQNDVGWCFWTYKKLDSTSCMVSVPKPTYWDEVVTFAQLPLETSAVEKVDAARPPNDHLEAAAHGLLENIPFSACRVNAGYLEALGLRKS